MWTSPYRVYTNEKQTEVLNATDEGAVLLCGEWDRIPHDVALRLGLVDEQGKTHSPLSIRRRQAKEDREAEPTAKDGD